MDMVSLNESNGWDSGTSRISGNRARIGCTYFWIMQKSPPEVKNSSNSGGYHSSPCFHPLLVALYRAEIGGVAEAELLPSLP